MDMITPVKAMSHITAVERVHRTLKKIRETDSTFPVLNLAQESRLVRELAASNLFFVEKDES
jgi:hypothetical protein